MKNELLLKDILLNYVQREIECSKPLEEIITMEELIHYFAKYECTNCDYEAISKYVKFANTFDQILLARLIDSPPDDLEKNTYEKIVHSVNSIELAITLTLEENFWRYDIFTGSAKKRWDEFSLREAERAETIRDILVAGKKAPRGGKAMDLINKKIKKLYDEDKITEEICQTIYGMKIVLSSIDFVLTKDFVDRWFDLLKPHEYEISAPNAKYLYEKSRELKLSQYIYEKWNSLILKILDMSNLSIENVEFIEENSPQDGSAIKKANKYLDIITW